MRYTRKRKAQLAEPPVYLRRLTVRGAYRLAHKRSMGLGGAYLSKLPALRTGWLRATGWLMSGARGSGPARGFHSTMTTLASCFPCFPGVLAGDPAPVVTVVIPEHGATGAYSGPGGGSDAERRPSSVWHAQRLCVCGCGGGAVLGPGAQSVADVAEAGVGRKGVTRSELMLGNAIAACQQAWYAGQYGNMLLATGPCFEVHSLRSDAILFNEVEVLRLKRPCSGCRHGPSRSPHRSHSLPAASNPLHCRWWSLRSLDASCESCLPCGPPEGGLLRILVAAVSCGLFAASVWSPWPPPSSQRQCLQRLLSLPVFLLRSPLGGVGRGSVRLVRHAPARRRTPVSCRAVSSSPASSTAPFA